MKKLLIFLLACFGTVRAQPIRFAFVTDTHVGAPETAIEDLQRTVDDINSLPNIDFVVFTGDVTDYGADREFAEAKRVLDGLTRKWYIFPGNHDTKWSENGCNSFRKVFGAERFAFDFGKYRFIGCGSGPNMRMSPGLVAREDVLWLRSEVDKLKNSDKPVIFMNHYPLDNSLSNWYLLIDELKKTNVQAALCGHGHANQKLDFEGIPGTMGRSNLRAKDAVGGYNVVTIQNDTMSFAVRTPAVGQQPGQTAAPWRTIFLTNHQFSRDKNPYPRPSYQLNDQYKTVVAAWEKQDSSDIGAGIVADKAICIYPNTAGQVVALSLTDGSVKWRFPTGGKVYSTPALHKKRVVVASTDGTIYCLDKRNGQLLWKHDTGKPIVACPLISDNTVYIGSSEGKFRALSLNDGAVRWTFANVNGFVESVPVADRQTVYFGSWGSTFYALNRKTGQPVWTWTNEKIRNFSPAACTPVLTAGRIFLQTPDRTVTALAAKTGKELWKSNQHKGFEASGLSQDGSLFYVKCMSDSVWAFSTRSDTPQAEWFVNCHYGAEISPSPIVERSGTIFVPTDEGVLYAIDRRTHQLSWAHKLSNAMVNRVFPLSNRDILISTMDGKVARLRQETR
ncbi:outer membrane protein assembly factor BamB family protein [Spirosoma koreense]